MTEKVFLSIVIPMYNGKEYIRSTVESVLKIKHSKEILIIDDGSTDNSFEYCNELWKDNNQIIVMQKENGGIVDARNFGMNYASGKYIIFVDHDDIVVSEVVDKAIDRAENKDLEMVFWTTERMYDSGETIPCDTVKEEKMYSSQEVQNILLKEMLMNQNNSNISYIGHLWAVLYRMDIIKSNHIKFKRFVDIEDDYLFVFDCLTKAEKVLCIPETGYLWRYNRASETYRMKYIPDILYKYNEFYTYIISNAEKAADISDIKDRYICYIKQYVIVFSVENIFTCINKSKKDKQDILKVIKEQKSAFMGNPIITCTKRRKRIFMFIKHGFYRLAFFYVYLDSLYRKLKKKVGHN